MKEKIFKPKIGTLIVFGFLISPIILVGLYILLFFWFLDFEFFLKPIYIIAILVGLLSFFVDRKYKIELKKYVILSIILLTIYVLLSYPIRDWLKAQSELQGQQIGHVIEKYKEENGFNPDDLESDYFKDVPKRSYIGSRFYYEKYLRNDSIETCFISFFSFRGYHGYYNIERKTWIYRD